MNKEQFIKTCALLSGAGVFSETKEAFLYCLYSNKGTISASKNLQLWYINGHPLVF